MTLPTGVVTFLFTDIEGSTSKWDAAGDEMAVAVAQHDELLESAITTRNGSVVKKMGDGFMAVFSDPAAAVAAALEAQQALRSTSWGQSTGDLRVRVGIHTGPGQPTNGDYVGPSPNRAARLEAAGHGGQILVSAATRELVGDRIDDTRFRDLGEHQLRGLSRLERIFQVTGDDLEAEFPPLRTESTPTNIPARVSEFVGRRDELVTLTSTLGETRLTTVTGAGGAGKTTLAVEAARKRMEHHRGGVWLFELASLSDGRLLSAELLGAMRRPAPADRDPEEVLLEALSSQRCLLVFDNCEHLLSDVAPLVAAILRQAPDVTILATSREPLGVRGEHVWSIPTMSIPSGITVQDVEASDAGALFLTRAFAADRTFRLDEDTAPIVTRICRRLDGLPLAIELATARLGTMSVHELDGRLEDRFKLLRARTVDEVPHHQTLRDTVAWSYDLLEPDTQRLYRSLSIFAGGFDAEAAEAVEGDRLYVLDGLDQLVTQSLVEADRGERTRYRMLETIRQFGSERLRQEEEHDAAARAHLDWVLNLVKEGARGMEGRDQIHWLHRFRREIDNIRAALTWARDHDPVAGGTIASALSRFFWMYAAEGDSTVMTDSTSFLREGYDWAVSMLEAGGDALPDVLRGRLQLGIGGLLCVRLGRYEEALDRLSEAKAVFERRDDRSTGWATFYQGVAGFGRVSLDESIATFEEALRLHSAAKDQVGMASSSLLVGLYLSIREPGSGRPYLERFAAGAEASGVPLAVAHAADTLALSDALEDTVGEESRHGAAEALATFRKINNYACLCHALGSAAALLGRTGDVEGAGRAVGVSDTIRQRLNMIIAPYEERESYVRKVTGEAARGTTWQRAVAEGRTFEPDEGIDWVISRLGHDPARIGTRP